MDKPKEKAECYCKYDKNQCSIHFRCNHCGMFEADGDWVAPKQRRHARTSEQPIWIPKEHCTKCNRLNWEIVARNHYHSSDPYQRLRTTNGTYSRLAKAAGIKPKKIITSKPLQEVPEHYFKVQVRTWEEIKKNHFPEFVENLWLRLSHGRKTILALNARLDNCSEYKWEDFSQEQKEILIKKVMDDIHEYEPVTVLQV